MREMSEILAWPDHGGELEQPGGGATAAGRVHDEIGLFMIPFGNTRQGLFVEVDFATGIFRRFDQTGFRFNPAKLAAAGPVFDD
ncbi:MAG: hypothetical protein WDN28_20590 [Chthoniobacter sp.]